MYEHRQNGPMDTLSIWSSRVAMWLPAAIICLMLLDITYRYIFVSSTMWINETALWLGGFIYLFAGLYAMQQRSHIRISIIYDMAPLWLKRVFDILSTLCLLFFVFWVVWGGLNSTVRKFFTWERFGTFFDPPIPATNRMLILVLLLLFSLQAVSNFIRDWRLPALVRKLYDVCVTVLVVVCCVYAIGLLLGTRGVESSIPDIWRYGISAGLLVVIVAVVVGLIRDFHVAAVPFEDNILD